MAETLDYAGAVDADAPARRPVAELLGLALPTVAQMASYTVMQFVDTLMLARVGNRIDAPTAAANSGLLSFSIISLGMGVLWVVNTLVSQAFGRRDYRECGRYLWQGVWFGVAFAVVLLPVLPFASTFFRLLGHDPALARLESQYMQVVLGGAVLKLVGAAFGQFLLAIDRPKAVMSATIVGVSVNALAAWVLIFGHFGVPPLGVVGAAWAQNVGVLVETGVLVVVAMRPAVRRIYGVGNVGIDPSALQTLLKVGVPSGVQTVADVLAWAAFQMWVLGVFGTVSMAANAFVFRYMSVSFMPAYGLSVAVTALVGRYIGRRQPEVARQRANLGFAIAAVYMLTCGLLFFAGRNLLIGLFAADAEVQRIGAMMLVFAAVYQFFDAMYIIYNGALRGAGDTLVPALMTGVLCWGITVFGGYGVAKWWWHSLGPTGPWVIATAYGVVIGVFMLMRFRRGRWMAINLEGREEADRVPPLSPVLGGEG